MASHEFTIELNLADKKMRSQLQELLGDMSAQVKKDAIQLKVEWDKKYLDKLNEQAKKIGDQFPEIAVQFKYQLDKHMLEELEKEYYSMYEFGKDSSREKEILRAKERTIELFKELKEEQQKIANIDPKLIPEETVQRIQYLKDELGTMGTTLIDMEGKGKKAFSSLSKEVRTVLNAIFDEADKNGFKYEAYDLLPDTKPNEKKVAYIKELGEMIKSLKLDMKELEKQGGIDIAPKISEATKDQKVHQDIEALKKSLEDLRIKAEKNISLHVQTEQAKDAIKYIEELLGDIPNPYKISVELTNTKQLEEQVAKLQKALKDGLGNIPVNLISSGINISTTSRGGSQSGTINYTDQQLENNDKKLQDYVKRLKEYNDQLHEFKETPAIREYQKITTQIDAEKKSVKELTAFLKEQVEVYKTLQSARDQKKKIDYINNEGVSKNGVPTLATLQNLRGVIGGTIYELAQKGKNGFELIEKFGIKAKDQVNEITTAFDKYKKGLIQFNDETEKTQQLNNNIQEGLNRTRKSIEDIVKTTAGKGFRKGTLYSLLDKFQSGEIGIDQVLDKVRELAKLTSTGVVPSVAIEKTEGVFAQLTKEINAEIEAQKEVKQTSTDAGETTSQALEKTTEKAKRTQKTIEELTEMIREMAQEAAAIGTLDNPLSGYGGRSKGAWKRLADISLTPESKNYNVAKEIIDNAGLFVETGDVELLNAIKARSNDLVGDTAEIQKWIISAVDGYIRKLSKSIDKGVKEAVETKLYTLSKTDYKKWVKSTAVYKNSEEFEHNFELELNRKLEANEAWQAKNEKTGRLGRWYIQVEVPVDKIKQLKDICDKPVLDLEHEFDSIKQKLTALSQAGGFKNLQDPIYQNRLASIVKQYREYQQEGGKQNLKEVLDKKSLSEFTAEYNRQKEAIKQQALEAQKAKEVQTQAANKVEKEERDITEAVTETTKKLIEQGNISPAQIQVEPKLNPQDFANRVTALLEGVFAKINVVVDKIIAQAGTTEVITESVSSNIQSKSKNNSKKNTTNKKDKTEIEETAKALDKIADSSEKASKKVKEITESVSDLKKEAKETNEALKEVNKTEEQTSKKKQKPKATNKSLEEAKKQAKETTKVVEELDKDAQEILRKEKEELLPEIIRKAERNGKTLEDLALVYKRSINGWKDAQKEIWGNKSSSSKSVWVGKDYLTPDDYRIAYKHTDKDYLEQYEKEQLEQKKQAIKMAEEKAAAEEAAAKREIQAAIDKANADKKATERAKSALKERQIAQERFNNLLSNNVDEINKYVETCARLDGVLGDTVTDSLFKKYINSIKEDIKNTTYIPKEFTDAIARSKIQGKLISKTTDEIDRYVEACARADKIKTPISDTLFPNNNQIGGQNKSSSTALMVIEDFNRVTQSIEQAVKASKINNEEIAKTQVEAEEAAKSLDKMTQAEMAFNADMRKGVTKSGDLPANMMAKAWESVNSPETIDAVKRKIQDIYESIGDNKTTRATVEWIQELENEYKLVGKSAEEYAERIRQIEQAQRDADGGYGLDILMQVNEALQESVALEENKAKVIKKAYADAEKALLEYQNLEEKNPEVLEQLVKKYTEAKAAYDALNDSQKTGAQYIKQVIAEQGKAEKAVVSGIKKLQGMMDDMAIKGSSDLLGDKFKTLDKDFIDFKTNVDNMSTLKAQEELDKLIYRAKELKQEAADIKKEMSSIASAAGVEALQRRITTLLDYSKKLSANTRAEAEGILKQLIPGKTTSKELKDLTAQFDALYGRARAAGELGLTFGDRWRRGLASLARYLTTFASFYRVVGYIRQAVTTIKELDDALIDLKKTTTMTNEQLEEFYHNSANIGKQVGTTAKEIISQAAAWSRLGYQTKEEATAMAELSAQFAAISPGMSLDTATDGLVSTMKAFHIDVENVEEEVMDSINRIGNTMATSNEEVVEMLTRSSAAMNAANNSLAETIALESAAVQITRNAETTGTAFRTISMRIRGLDEETEEASEDFEVLQGKIANLTKTAKTPGGISLFTDKDKTTYKSTYQLLKDIADIYHDLTDKQQAGLLEALAGKRGGQVLAGILDDFSEVERAMNEIEQSAGSADDEMQIIRESISYQLNALKQTWVGFLTDLIDRGVLQQILENLTILSEKFIELTKNNPAGVAVGVYTLAKALKALFAGGIIRNLTELVKTLTAIRASGLTTALFSGSSLNSLKQATNSLISVRKVATDTGATIAKTATIIEGGLASHGVVNGMKVTTTNMNAMGVAAQDAATETKVLATTTTGLGASLSALLPILIAIGAVYLGTKAWDELTITVEEAETELAEVSDRITTLKNQIEELEELDYRTAAQEAKLKNLREELDLEEQIYAVKQRQLIQEKYGTKLSDYTDEGNYRAKLIEDTNGQNKGSSSYLLTINDSQIKKIEELNEQIRFYQEQIESVQHLISEGRLGEGIGANQIEALRDKLNKAKQELSELNAEQDNMQADIAAKIINYTEAISEMKADLEFMKSDTEGLFTAEDIAQVEKTIKLYEDQLQRLKLANGSYAEDFGAEYVSAIESAFEHVEFEGLKEELVQMAKDGSLSVDYLVDNFSELLFVMGLTTDQADVLYTYLKRLADPLRSERNKFASQWMPTTSGSLGEYQQQQYQQVMNYINKLSDEEMQILLDAGIDWSTFDYEAFRNKAEELLNENGPLEIQVEASTIADSVTGINERLKAQFDELGEAYQAIYYGDNGFSLEDVDNDMLKGIVDNFIDSAVELGIAEDEARKSANDFMRVLTTQGSTAADVQQAFNDLATSYFYSAEGLKELNEDTADSIKQQLEQMGIVNAEEVVDFYLNVDPDKSFVTDLKNTVADAMNQLGEGGSVNLSLRPEIDTAVLNEAGWEAGEGVATVFSSIFSNEAGDIAINVTPILPDGTVLTPEQLERYANAIIDGADDVHGIQIGAKFVGQDAIAKAEQAAIKIHELQDVYYNYDEILQSVTKDNQAEIEAQLEAAGVTEAHAIVVASLSANLEAQALESQAVEAATSDMAGETENASAEFVQEANMSNLAKVYLADLVATQTVFNNQGLDVTQKVKALSELASAYFGTAAAAKLVEMTDNRGYDHSYSVSPEEAWRRILAEFSTFEAPTVDFSKTAESGKQSAGSAGKDAGKAYTDAFKEELDKLKGQYERGEIDLKTYLAKYRDLIEKYFGDTEKYAEERAQALHDYMEELKGYYDSAISGVTTLLDHRISAIQKQKDAALKAIEAERKAATEGYEAQIKAIDKLIKEKNKQIKALEKEKKELEKQKKAYEEQKKALDKQKTLIQKNSIDPLQDEIDKIQKANDERERQLQLQKDLYELERLQNQRTQFVYKDGQMVYQTDPEAARNAREQVKKDEQDEKVSKLEKQIEVYEKQIETIEKEQELIDEQIELIDQQIEGIEEQIELINEEIEALEEEKESIQEILDGINEFYDKLKEETEEYFDKLIEALEETKSKWERLAEIDKIASAWKDVGQIVELMGYSVEDVLNDTPGAFEAFESAYIACLGNMNGKNKDYIQGLAEATGKSVEEIETLMNKMGDFGEASKEPLADLEKTAKDAGEALADAGTKASTASTGMGSYATEADKAASASGSLKENTEGVGDNIQGINDAVSGMDGTGVQGLIDKFEELRAKLAEIKAALGVVETGDNGKQTLSGMGSIAGAIESLNGMTLEGIIGQFDALLQSVESVVSALGGEIGGDEAPATNGGMGGTGAQSQGTSGSHPGGDEGSGGGSGLVGAIEAVKEATDKNIGVNAAEEGATGDGTVIGSFGALTTTVDKASTAIGNSESAESSADLIGSITSLGKKNTEVLEGGGEGGKGLINEWKSFNTELDEAERHITEMTNGLETVNGQTYETTLKVNLEISESGGSGGGLNSKTGSKKSFMGTAIRGNARGFYELDVLEALGLPNESGTWEALFKHNAKGTARLSGTALLNGDWAYEGGKTLIAEIGPELVVYPDGHFRTFDTPQMVNLPRGAVIFNHKQTSEILDTDNQVRGLSGKAHANGTMGMTPLSIANPDEFARMVQTAEILKANTEDMKVDLSHIGYATDDISKAVQNITNNNANATNITFGDLYFECNGIDSADVMNEVGNALQREFSGLALNAYQRAMAH